MVFGWLDARDIRIEKPIVDRVRPESWTVLETVGLAVCSGDLRAAQSGGDACGLSETRDPPTRRETETGQGSAAERRC